MKTRLLGVLLCCLLSVGMLHADEQSQADAAVANTLFDYDGSEEYATYKVNDDGSVDLIFASNTPDKLYEDILTQLQSHPHISSVLASKGGPVCKLF
ncbi:hypothetical protein [Sulfuriflexus mobilis]|uniref:hypothetical protein n=1 Tax=Sulfuriflexus mobilis TaxID=1811807 RepID=UPI000F825DC0|nr:hypothetical protein [Sulfuriflexus mobilis]